MSEQSLRSLVSMHRMLVPGDSRTDDELTGYYRTMMVSSPVAAAVVALKEEEAESEADMRARIAIAEARRRDP